jgi:hypothetical protein
MTHREKDQKIDSQSIMISAAFDIMDYQIKVEQHKRQQK